MNRIHRSALFATGLLVALAGCHTGTSPAVALPVQSPPEVVAHVVSSSLKEFLLPSGFVDSMYDVWMAVPPADSANAAIMVTLGAPVYSRTSGVLTEATASAIASGDSIEVWRDTSVSYSGAFAPTGAARPYRATQIVIAH